MTPTMDTGAKPTLDVQELILNAIAVRNYRPVDLITFLMHDSRLTENQLKNGLASLVDARVIELAPDRYVRRRQA